MRRSRILSTGFGNWLVPLVLGFLFLNGCQGTGMDYRKGMVTEGLIALQPQGRDSGSWESRDLTVDYQTVRNSGSLDLSGKVVYSSVLTTNFSEIEYFHLDVLFVDDQGHVLDMQGLASSAKSYPEDPEVFKVSLALPARATAMAFSYRGQARDTGDRDSGGGQSYFWHYPIH